MEGRSPQIPVFLPETAKQGPDDWWILYSHFDISIDPESGPGIIQVDVGANGRITNQVVIESLGRDIGFAVSRTELLNGQSRYFTLSPVQTHHMANYMQDRGVRPRGNELHFEFSASGGAIVKELVFRGDTKILRIPLGPPELEFEPAVDGSIFVRDKETPVEVDIHSLGWPVKKLRMSVRDVNGAFAFRDASPRTVVEIKSTASIGYHVTPARSGTHELVFLAEGSNLGPLEGTLTITVNEPAGAAWTWGIVAGLYLILGMILYAGVRQLAGGRGEMVQRINEWRGFAQQNRAKAAALVSAPFIMLALLLNFYDSVVYGGGTPGIMVAVITILYLLLTAAAGFISPLRVAGIGPVLAHGVVTLLWIVVSKETYESITYESGWVGVAVSIAVASAVIWLFAFAGNLIGEATRSEK